MTDVPNHNQKAAAPEPISFEILADDVVDATRAYAGYRSRGSRVVGAVLLAAGALGWWVTRDPFWLPLAPIGAFALAAGLLRAVDRSMARAQPATAIGTACTMLFGDDALEFRQGAVEGRFAWSEATEVRDGERAILVLRDERILASIPKRAFASPERAQAATAWLSQRVRTQQQLRANLS